MVVVVVVVVMVMVVKGLQLLLLENGYVLEAQHRLGARCEFLANLCRGRIPLAGWKPVAPALAGSLLRQHWLEACGATHSLLAAPAAIAPAAPAAAPAPLLPLLVARRLGRLFLGYDGPRPRPRPRRLHGEPVLVAVIIMIIA